MRKVAWPTSSEIVNSSIVVIIGVVVMGALIFLFDAGAIKLVDIIFG